MLGLRIGAWSGWGEGQRVELAIEWNSANVTGTVELLVAARDAKIKQVVFAVSSHACDNTETLPKSETMAASLLSPRALQKYTRELYLKIFSGT